MSDQSSETDAYARMAAARSRNVTIVLVVSALTLLGGYLFKAQCLQPWIDNHQYEVLCYNDLQPLYGIRGVAQGIFPYVHAEMSGGELLNGGIEYPVLTGVFMWFAGLFTDDANSYLRVSAILLAPFGMLASYLLARLSGPRALLWAAAPAIVLYAFHNWDLLVVAAMVAGFWAWRREKPAWAAVAFAVGGAFKLFPIFFLAPLALDRLFRRDVRGAIVTSIAGVGTWVAINLPFALANFEGWFGTYEFHQLRTPNFDSLWFQTWPDLSVSAVNRLTTALLVGTFLAILGVSIWRARRTGGAYPFVQVCAALLAAFLLWNKVHSPQYTLWLLPFFVLVGTSVVWWLAYTAVDLLVYVGVFRWFFNGAESARHAMQYGVWGRAGLLLLLIGVFLWSKPALTGDDPVAAGDREPLAPDPPLRTAGAAAPS
ncbi:MAG TPA: glycosyltransferase 87 family protein [Actinomycetota bacterium]|jgi:uncharacterized membrane protein